MPIPAALHRTQAWYRRLTVPQFTVVTGLLVVAAGTLILATPLCSSPQVGLWQAFFTAASAVTVTGLSVIDVGRDLTGFGQGVLALMILVGGLGLMAITTFLQGFVVRGTALRRRLDRGQTLDEFGVGGVGNTFRGIALTAAVLIVLGALVLYFYGFTDLPRGGGRLWAALFHSISAYNNAGFGLWGDSLEHYRNNRVVNGVVMLLIILGGLGWRVTSDLWTNRKRLQRRNLSLHTRLVLRATVILIAAGTVGLLVTESLTRGHMLTSLAWPERLLTALFESVSTRTAGFTTVPLSLTSFSDSGLLLMMTLMFIGASPGGTGGGIKTTTVVASLLFVLGMAMLLALSSNLKGDEPFTFLELLFTCISAFATVGLDLGVTENLSRFGQLVLVIGMFVGRLGILLLLSAIWETVNRGRPARQNRIGFPRDDLYV